MNKYVHRHLEHYGKWIKYTSDKSKKKKTEMENRDRKI